VHVQRGHTDTHTDADATDHTTADLRPQQLEMRESMISNDEQDGDKEEEEENTSIWRRRRCTNGRVGVNSDTL